MRPSVQVDKLGTFLHSHSPGNGMERKLGRPVASLVVVATICLVLVARTEGFDNIRAVQFLLIFVAGALVGLALGIIRLTRRANSAT
jgi:hypothetical protein